MENIWGLIEKISAYVGGIGTISLAFLNWHFSKRLEILKAKTEKTSYITKTQFDAEFKIYQELSRTSFSMLLAVADLFPMNLDTISQLKEKEQHKIRKERYDRANDELYKFQNKLFEVAPFITKEIYDLFNNLREESRLQFVSYYMIYLDPNKKHGKTLVNLDCEGAKRAPQLKEMHKQIIETLREYLSSLKVLE